MGRHQQSLFRQDNSGLCRTIPVPASLQAAYPNIVIDDVYGMGNRLYVACKAAEACWSTIRRACGSSGASVLKNIIVRQTAAFTVLPPPMTPPSWQASTDPGPAEYPQCHVSPVKLDKWDTATTGSPICIKIVMTIYGWRRRTSTGTMRSPTSLRSCPPMVSSLLPGSGG